MCEQKRFRFCSCGMSQPLLFSTITIIVAGLIFAEGTDMNLISERFSVAKQIELWCLLSNSTSAISWISPDLNNENSTVSEIYPKLNETFSCDLSANRECTFDWWNNPWKPANSRDNYFGPILDRRWENFRTHTTTNQKEPIRVGRYGSDFHVAFSVKMGHGAQIYLCNGPVEKSQCYKISIGDYGNNFTILLKINFADVTQKVEPDLANFIVTEHNNKTGWPLNEKEWRHFVVTKQGAVISMRRYTENDTALLFKCEDSEPIESEHFEMYVYSPYVSGLWKIHDYDFLHTNTSSTTQLGPLLQPIEIVVNGRKTYYLCVEMFAIICPNCRMTIEFSNQENSYKKTFESKTENVWETIRYFQENVAPSSDGYQMKIATHGKNGGFWAIDDVRQCSKKEVRVSKITVKVNEQVVCQALQFPSKVLRKTDEVTSISESDCPVGTFGKTCTPCELVFGEQSKFCQNKKMCYFDKNSDQKCHCAGGYQGKYCDQLCPLDRYGSNCVQECGHCLNAEQCDRSTGHCNSGCEVGFTGKTCHEQLDMSVPTFVNPPSVSEIGTTHCKVQLTSTETTRNSNEAKYYIYQISIDNKSWTDVNKKYLITDTSVKKVENLKIVTTYHIRAILVSEDGIKYEPESTPSTAFKTACIPIPKNYVQIAPKNTSAEIKIRDQNSDMCPIEEYQVYLNNAKVNTKSVLRNLRPFTNYTVRFTKPKIKYFEVNFTTLEGTPDAVKDVQLIKKDSNSITIKWRPPHNPNGVIRYYTIVYKNIGKVSSSQDILKAMGKNSTKLDHIENNYATLSNLELYSKYSIEIYANTLLRGKPFVFEEATLQSDEASPSELSSRITTKPPSTTKPYVEQSSFGASTKKIAIIVIILVVCCVGFKAFKIIWDRRRSSLAKKNNIAEESLMLAETSKEVKITIPNCYVEEETTMPR